jgi:hypothetical protein
VKIKIYLGRFFILMKSSQVLYHSNHR